MMEKTIPVLPDFKGAPLAWLQSVPGSADISDLFELNEDDVAVKFISRVLEHPSFELSFQVERMEAGARFHHFFFESRNLERVFGTRNLAVGYPMLLSTHKGIPIQAPLFLWQCQVEPHATNPDKWILQRQEQHAILPNYPLFHFLDQVYSLDLSQKAARMVENWQYSAQQLGDFCENLLLMLKVEEDGFPFSIKPGLKGLDADYALSKGRLIWSAVIGLFPALPKYTRTTPPVVTAGPVAGSEWHNQFSLLPLDPSQRKVFEAQQQSAVTVVEGASGTGKTYLISALMMSALMEGKKCLVVSKSIQSLRRAQKLVLDGGFGDLSFILRDLSSDRLMLADMLRAAADSKSKPEVDANLLQMVLAQSKRERNKLDQAWERLHAPVLGNFTYTQTVGWFLRAHRTEAKDLLLTQLNPSDFDFVRGEYQRLAEAIRTSEPLFARFPTLSHPLAKLNPSIFTEKTVSDGFQWTIQTVRQLLEQATALHHQYITRTNEYAELLSAHFEQHYARWAQQTQKVREAIDDGTNRFGAEFGKPLSTVEKLYGTLSDRYKQMVIKKEEVGAAFEQLRKQFQEHRYFDFSFPEQYDRRDLPKIAELTAGFEEALQGWQKRIPSVVREEVRRLNARTIHSGLEYKSAVEELEHNLDAFLDHFNGVALYGQVARHEMLTIPKRQEYLEELIAQLEETQFSLRDFTDFYTWQKHWLSLSEPEQKVVRALCKIKPSNWMAAFDSWYLYHFLQARYSPSLLWEEETLSSLEQSAATLRKLIPDYLNHAWQQRKISALKKLKSNDSKGYKTWFGKDNRKLSSDLDIALLFKEYLEPLTETLPVLLVSPQVANDVVQHANQSFDLILVDEAHHISKQQGYPLFEMAKHLVVMGDTKQDMTPDAEDDLMEFCKSLGVPTYTLEYQHQEAPEDWLEFNQIAFNTPFKRLPSGRSAIGVTKVENVEGRYDEQLKINEAEARQIIDWLNLVEQTPAKTYPVVGIACATYEQRDLIAAQLLRVRQQKAPGYEKIQQMQLNGLGVYQFSELQGLHVDVLLISLCHGAVGASGQLTKELAFWNTTAGLNQLHVALTRARQRVFIAHSIPPGLYQALASDPEHRGTCILSHLVTFGEYLQRGDQAAARGQLQVLKKVLRYPEQLITPTVFMEEVELALRPYFEPGCLQRNTKIAGVTLPLAIQYNGRMFVPLFDGVFAPTELPSYEWEQTIKQYFDRHGIRSIPVLSAQWWKSPRMEARRLATVILSEEESLEADLP
jgi:hypothetical protein